MFYRENGQFKTSYAADQQIFTIAQDRYAILGLLAIAFLVIPLVASDYTFQAILIPFVIMTLGRFGPEYSGGRLRQISLGTAAFMAVGAYAAYNFQARFENMPLLIALIGGGLCAMVVGVVFGLPSLRIRGLYLAVATLAAQFFIDWITTRAAWVTNNSSSGSVSAKALEILGWQIDTPMEKYLLCLAILCVLALGAKNLVRSSVGREWMAMRDMDVAASVIGIRPVYAKLSAFAVSSFIVGIAGALWGFVHLGSWEPGRLWPEPIAAAAVHDHHWWPGLHRGQHLWCRLLRAAAPVLEPGAALDGPAHFHRHRHLSGAHDFWCPDRVLPDCGTARFGQTVGYRPPKAARLALPALKPVPQPPQGSVSRVF